MLGAEHQRAGRADRDAVAAVDAGRVGQRVGVLGGDAGVEPAAGDGDRERVLVLLAAGVDALVAEDALGVVAHVEVVVDLGRRVHGGGGLAVGLARGGRCAGGRARGPAARAARSARARRRSARGSPAAAGVVDRSTEEARNSITILRLWRTRSESVRTTMPGSTLREQAGTSVRAPSTSTTQTRHALAGVQRLAVAQRRRVDADLRGTRRGSSSPRAPRPAGRRSVSVTCGGRLRGGHGQLDRVHGRSSVVGTLPAARWPTRPPTRRSGPRPQIEASRIAWPISAISASSSCTRAARAAGQQAGERLLLAHGADAAGHALAAALVAEERGDRHQQLGRGRRVSSSTSTTPEPSVAPDLARVLEGEPQVELVGRDEAAGRAAEQHRAQVAPAGRRRRARAARAAWCRTAPRRCPGRATAPRDAEQLRARWSARCRSRRTPARPRARSAAR